MKLKVGMIVRVKTYKEALDTYDTKYDRIYMPFSYMPDTTDDWLGKVVTIRRITGDWAHLEEAGCTWHKDMFKPIATLSFKNLQEH